MKRLWIAVAAAGLGGILGSGCAHKEPAAVSTTQPLAPGAHDRQFVREAGELNLYEIDAGRLAQERASSMQVRNLARMLTADHNDAGGRLQTLAEQKNVPMPHELTAEHVDELRRLYGLSGPAFEQEYLQQQLRAHRTAFELYEEEANKGEDPGVRALAQDLLPDIQAHARHVEQLRPGTWTSPAKPTGDQPIPQEHPTTKATGPTTAPAK